MAKPGMRKKTLAGKSQGRKRISAQNAWRIEKGFLPEYVVETTTSGELASALARDLSNPATRPGSKAAASWNCGELKLSCATTCSSMEEPWIAAICNNAEKREVESAINARRSPCSAIQPSSRIIISSAR